MTVTSAAARDAGRLDERHGTARWWPSDRDRIQDVALVIFLSVVAVAVRRPDYLLHHPLWLDEAWVADSRQVGLGDLLRVTASTPIGFTALLRLVPRVDGPETMRLVPLAFAVGTVVLSWFLGRGVAPGRRRYAFLLALGAALLPAGVLRHDLKQYTADACAAAALLWLTVRAERSPRRRRLAGLAGVATARLLVSHTILFVGLAAYASLALVALGRRDWCRCRDTVVAGLAWVLSAAAVYVLAAARGDTPQLRRYWHTYYIPWGDGAHAAVTFVTHRATALLDAVTLGPGPVVPALAAAGVAALIRLRLLATAMVVPLVLAGQVVAAGLRRYPLWDDRTSLFTATLLTSLIMISAMAGTDVPGGRAYRLAGYAALTAVLGLLVAGGVRRYGTPLPDEDVSWQMQQILRLRAPGTSCSSACTPGTPSPRIGPSAR